MPRVTFVKKARKADKAHGIKKGDSYYWWKFRTSFGGYKVVSKTAPRRSQLTRSEFWGTIYDIQDRKRPENYEDAQSEVEDIKAELEQLRDEQEEKRNNMPEQLQDSGSGEMLQNRYDSLDSAVSELDCLDIPDKEQVLEDAGKDDKRGEQEILDEKLEEVWNDVTSALDNISD